MLAILILSRLFKALRIICKLDRNYNRIGQVLDKFCYNSTSYEDALKKRKIDYWIKEEVVSSERLKISAMDPSIFERLIKVKDQEI